MESDNKDDFIIGSYKDLKKEQHRENIQRIEQNLKDLENDETKNPQAKREDYQTDLNYHQMRLKCIDKFEKDHTVPTIIVEDKYFDEFEIAQNKESTEELYPNDKEISLYETNKDSEKEFVVKQRPAISTCYFMAWILGLIGKKGMGNYIKQNIVREHDKTHAIVRLHDEDGLPVDIVVSKVRPNGDNERPLWLVMLDKAACVIMNRNKFGSAPEPEFVFEPTDKNPNEKEKHELIPAQIISGINWYDMAEQQSNNKGQNLFKEGCFKKLHITWSPEEELGAQLLFGKSYFKEHGFKPKGKTNNTKLDFLRYCLSKNKLVVASTDKKISVLTDTDNKKNDNEKNDGIPRNHTVCFSKIVEQGIDTNFPNGYIEVIESYRGIHKIRFDNLKKFGLLCAVDLPDFKEKDLDKNKNDSEKELMNINVGGNDKSFSDNKNNNLHPEINLCYNKNEINDLEEDFKMQNNFNEVPVNDKNLDFSTLIDLNSISLEDELKSSCIKLKSIINATKKIQDARKGIKGNQIQHTGTVVHTGTDYHGDRLYFMNGAVSEIVEWDEDKINVFDVNDGEILFSGTKNEILNNIENIRKKLINKYESRKEKLRNLVSELVYPLACENMRQVALSFDNDLIELSNVTVTLVDKQGKNLSTVVNTVKFDLKKLLECTLERLAQNNWPMDQQNIRQTLRIAMVSQLKNNFNDAQDFLDGNATNLMFHSYTQALMNVLEKINKLGQCDIDFSLQQNLKVVLTNACKLKEGLNPDKVRVILTGDYGDRGKSSSEIMCHIKDIHDQIAYKAEKENNPNLKECFKTTIGNHESSYAVAKDDNESAILANSLCKKMIAGPYLISGDTLKSKDDKQQDCTFSFSHTAMLKGSYPLILKQILELTELSSILNPMQNDPNGVLKDSNNQIVVWIKSLFPDGNGNVSKTGEKILCKILNRFNEVRGRSKYKNVFEKFFLNKKCIEETLRLNISDFSRNGLLSLGDGIFNIGDTVYNELNKILTEEDYINLRYLSMDVFCQPIASSFDDKIKLAHDLNSEKLGTNFNFDAFSNFLSRLLPDIYLDFDIDSYPPCFMSVVGIASQGQLSSRALNNFTWEESSVFQLCQANWYNKDLTKVLNEGDDVDKRFFEKKWPEKVIQIYGHTQRQKHDYLSLPGGVNGDIAGSIGYNKQDKHKEDSDYQCTFIGTAHIDLSDLSKSHTEVLKYNHLNDSVETQDTGDLQQTRDLKLVTSPNNDYFKGIPDLNKCVEKLESPGQSQEQIFLNNQTGKNLQNQENNYDGEYNDENNELNTTAKAFKEFPENPFDNISMNNFDNNNFIFTNESMDNNINNNFNNNNINNINNFGNNNFIFTNESMDNNINNNFNNNFSNNINNFGNNGLIIINESMNSNINNNISNNINNNFSNNINNNDINNNINNFISNFNNNNINNNFSNNNISNMNNNDNNSNQNSDNSICLIFRLSNYEKPILLNADNPDELASDLLERFKKELLEEDKKFNSVNWDDFQFIWNAQKIDLKKSVKELNLTNNANILVSFKKEKLISLSLSFEPCGTENNNVINFNDNTDINMQNIENEENKKTGESVEITKLNGLRALKEIIDNLARSGNLSEEIFWEQIKQGNLFINNACVKTEDLGKTFFEFLNFDVNNIPDNPKVSAVMKNVSLADIKIKKFFLTKANKGEEINASNELFNNFKSVDYCLADKLITVIERWCKENGFIAGKFIGLIKSNKIKLKFGESTLSLDNLDSSIKNIDAINLEHENLDLTFECGENVSLDNIKCKKFDIFFNVTDTGKDLPIEGFNETQTLKQIIENVDNKLEGGSYYDNIITQIKENKLKIIAGEAEKKEYTFKEADLDKPFYEIVDDIDKFAVVANDGINKLTIRFQIPTIKEENLIDNDLNVNQNQSGIGNNFDKEDSLLNSTIKEENLIGNDSDINQNQSGIGNNFDKGGQNQFGENDLLVDNYFNESNLLNNGQERFNLVNCFKALICLVIIFAFLSGLAFALKAILAVKIIFTCITGTCCVGLIICWVVNHYKKKNQSNVIISGLYRVPSGNKPENIKYPSQSQDYKAKYQPNTDTKIVTNAVTNTEGKNF